MTRILAAALVLAVGVTPASAQEPIVYCQVGSCGRLASVSMCMAIRHAAQALNWPPLPRVPVATSLDK